MSVSQIVFVYGGLDYYASMLMGASKYGVPTNWVVPLHNINFPEDHPHCAKVRRQTDRDFAKMNNVAVRDMNWLCSQSEGVFFTCEGTGIGSIKGGKKFSLTVNTDFRGLYPKYIKNVDHVVFPNKKFVDYYEDSVAFKFNRDKHIYLGSPKYDAAINAQDVNAKYGFPNKPKALVLLPKLVDQKKVNLKGVLNTLKARGYYVITKTRIKDSYSSVFHGDSHFEDSYYYPHTSLELIKASDIVINFDSTGIKEAVMLERPSINFRVKAHVNPLAFLYNNICTINIEKNVSDLGLFGEKLDSVEGMDFAEDFRDLKQKYLFQSGQVGEKILEFAMGQS